MAIVFVSPRKKQITLIIIIASIFAVFLIGIFLVIFLFGSSNESNQIVFKKPNIKIDFSVLDSDQLKNLIALDPIEYVFIYNAIDSAGKNITGKITAVSQDAAQAKLQALKYNVGTLEIEKNGRENPFDSYYQVIQNTKK